MTTVDLITALFYEVDEQLRAIPKHPEAHLWPSEVVTFGLLHALKGGSEPCVLSVVDARLSAVVSPCPGADTSLSPLHDASGLEPDLLGGPDGARVIDTYGIELIHPMREGRSPQLSDSARAPAHRSTVYPGRPGGGRICRARPDTR